VFISDILFKYKPQKGLKLNYRLTYNMTGRREGKDILETKLELFCTYCVVDIIDSSTFSLSLSLDRGSFIKNNMEKNLPYVGERILFVLSETGNIIDRKSEIPYGFLDYFTFPFPVTPVNIGSQWESKCRVNFPNIQNPVELISEFNFLRFKTFKAYNCSHISFTFKPLSITLSPDFKQNLSGNGYLLFDNNSGTMAFLAFDTLVDTGALGLVFKASLKKEIGPFMDKGPSYEAGPSSDEYFLSKY